MVILKGTALILLDHFSSIRLVKNWWEWYTLCWQKHRKPSPQYTFWRNLPIRVSTWQTYAGMLWYSLWRPPTQQFITLPLFKVLPFIFPLLWSTSPSCSSNCSRASWRQLRKEDFPTQNPSLLWNKDQVTSCKQYFWRLQPFLYLQRPQLEWITNIQNLLLSTRFLAHSCILAISPLHYGIAQIPDSGSIPNPAWLPQLLSRPTQLRWLLSFTWIVFTTTESCAFRDTYRCSYTSTSTYKHTFEDRLQNNKKNTE